MCVKLIFLNFRTLVVLFSLSILLACNSKAKEETHEANNQAVGSVKNQLTESQMIEFEGGEFIMGSNSGTSNEQPAHKVKVNAFKIDKSPVTVEQFAAFVNETKHLTDAEKFGDSGVFNTQTQQWELKKGAYWLYPLGRNKDKAIANHPVTHISWNDAQAYCQYVGKRLPTEAEWEFAARNGGKSTSIYSWGDETVSNGQYNVNVWQGNSISDVQGADGFVYTSPVGHYGTTQAGLTDMGGNVWNWCEDTFSPYAGNNQDYETNPENKVMRGGSFFYDQNNELSYTVSYRAPNTSETSLFNIGFRCAADK